MKIHYESDILIVCDGPEDWGTVVYIDDQPYKEEELLLMKEIYEEARREARDMHPALKATDPREWVRKINPLDCTTIGG